MLVLSVGFYRSFDQSFQKNSFLAFTAEVQAENNEQDQGWELLLVNQANPIPEDYEVTLEKLSNGQMIDQRIYEPLQEMFDAARKSGVYPVIVSGYRSTEEQQKLLDEKNAAYLAEGYSKKQAKEKAEQWVAIPGTSEHQLGISVDINEDKLHSFSTEVYNWLKQNAHKFGFINRYPENKTAITGVINEPWHYRYVGIEAATEISKQGLCLEEYLTR
ncbi:M15 family metallopeptidase [Enterococcus xiangfangensis]|uniref:M15 family metallopeptidase n=1 Tax=Enterococcus xiangfangensis TaxID=1296537 RepID=UPI0035DD953A